jgi:hypothetical protein
LLLDAFRSTVTYHHDNILGGSRIFAVRTQVILIDFQASFFESTLFTYLRDAIISIKLLIMVIIVIAFFITSIGNTLV